MSRRCSNCGSLKVAEVTQNAGFSYGKALAGQIVFGPVGAVAGINGKKQTFFQCQSCGQSSDHLMDDYFSNYIDSIIKSGNESQLASMKQSYPGIEWEAESKVAPTSHVSASTTVGKQDISSLDDEEQTVIIKQAIQAYCSSNNINIFKNSDLKALLTRQLCAEELCYNWATSQLVEEGFLTKEWINDDLYYRYYSNFDDVRENVNKIKTENEKRQLGVNIYNNNKQKILENIFSIARSFPSLTIPLDEFNAMFAKMLNDNGWSDDETVTEGIWFSFTHFEVDNRRRPLYYSYNFDEPGKTKIVFKNLP